MCNLGDGISEQKEANSASSEQARCISRCEIQGDWINSKSPSKITNFGKDYFGK